MRPSHVTGAHRRLSVVRRGQALGGSSGGKKKSAKQVVRTAL
ncbi:hypothetical protein PATSB16_22060 [Pandoraea thiooxydans]|nr:hypothetical protein PATSB16_22060 [Pandoraea thiooxydans]